MDMAEFQLNMLSLNVRGMKNKVKRLCIFEYIKERKVDICFLQESHCVQEEEQIWKNEWGGDIVFSNGTNNARGVMILFKSKLNYTIHQMHKDNMGRLIIMKIEYENKQFNIVNLYAPNFEILKRDFYRTLFYQMTNSINTDDIRNIIIGGDFNLIFNKLMDRKGGNFSETNIYRETIDIIDQLISQHNLVDIWRLLNPSTKRYTWRQRNPAIHSRLDIWLISDHLTDCVKQTSILPSIRSDHSAITLSLEHYTTTKGKGYWKFNNSFVHDELYVNELIQNYNRWSTECAHFTDKRVVWEYLKYKIRNFSMNYGKLKNHETTSRVGELENKLSNITEQLESDDLSEEQCEHYHHEKNEIENELKEIEAHKAEGIMMRAKCLWYEQGEKSNRYFLNLIKQNSIKTNMNKLQLENGVVVKDPLQILTCQVEYYKELYSETVNKTPEQIRHFISNADTPSLNEQEKEMCDKDITEQEVCDAIQSFKKAKTPGSDGLTVEFYEKFWTIVKNNFMNVICESYQKGVLSQTQRMAIITLLDKGKNRYLLKNWRPISLLNVDYKIITKVIATRLKKVLPKLIHINQVGYVTERKITDNIRILSDIMFYTKEFKKPGMFINVDFSKAFDSVNWHFLLSTLHRFNFGSSFIKWVQIFYNDISSCIINNSRLSKSFKLERGVRQGDPLSPYLFILVIEILGIMIRNDKDIKGIVISNEEIKLLQYADDMTGCLSDVNSAKTFIHLINKFGLYSGLKLNTEKTEGMWLGSQYKSTNTPLGISWPRKPIRFLGVYLSYDEDEVNSFNFDNKIKKCKQVLNLWKTRHLSMYGRIQIVKTYIISQFLYVTAAIYIPNTYIVEVNHMIMDFIWWGRKPKLKREILYLPTSCGGLNVPNFRKLVDACYVKWVKRYDDDRSQCLWKTSFNYFISQNQINLNMLLKANYKIKDLSLKVSMPDFYFQLLHTWAMYGDSSSGKNTLIWYNTNLCMRNKSFFHNEFSNIGINSLYDLLDINSEWIHFSHLTNRGLPLGKWLTWNSIKSCCTKALKRGTVENIQCNLTIDEICLTLEGKELKKCTSRYINKAVAAASHKDVVHEGNIKKYLENGAEYDWQQIYNAVYRYIPDTGLREFQYKFLQDILINGNKLSQWRIKSDGTCELCNSEVETIEHQFWSCTYNKRFLDQLREWCHDIFNILVSKDMFFIGADEELLYHILCLAKKFLYTTRYNKVHPSFMYFEQYIQKVKLIEYKISQRNQKLNKYYSKWQPFDQLRNSQY